MTIKVGDKVRIKTEQELLAEGWKQYTTWWGKDGNDIGKSFCGETYKILRIDNENIYFVSRVVCRLPISAVAEVIPQTLDEYICSLPLEERARRFILIVPYVRPYGIEKIFYSTITIARYNSYGEALQATIEALKLPKE